MEWYRNSLSNGSKCDRWYVQIPSRLLSSTKRMHCYSQNWFWTIWNYEPGISRYRPWTSSLELIFSPVSISIHAKGFQPAKFADDLNVYKCFPSTTTNNNVINERSDVQKDAHTWGQDNRVQFDAAIFLLQFFTDRRQLGMHLNCLAWWSTSASTWQMKSKGFWRKPSLKSKQFGPLDLNTLWTIW